MFVVVCVCSRKIERKSRKLYLMIIMVIMTMMRRHCQRTDIIRLQDNDNKSNCQIVSVRVKIVGKWENKRSTKRQTQTITSWVFLMPPLIVTTLLPSSPPPGLYSLSIDLTNHLSKPPLQRDKSALIRTKQPLTADVDQPQWIHHHSFNNNNNINNNS